MPLEGEKNMDKSISRKVNELVEPIVNELELELVDVEYIKEGGHWYLRVFIDRDGGVDIDDCAEVSQKLSDILDKENPIPQAYMLEVSSPGVERPLKQRQDYEKYKGQLVCVQTKEKYKGYEQFTGYLQGINEDNQVILEYDRENISIPYELIQKANLTLEF